MSFDLVIRNGTVVDGSGFGSYRADVAVNDGRIAVVGRVRERGLNEIDAEAHVVTPGFVDGHTHLDAQLFWDHQGANSCWHGVTSVVMGNCGFTLAPVQPDAHALVVRNLERAEDIDPAVLAAGLPWGWETFPEFLDAVDAEPKAINYAANVGHSALRTWAMGERAFEETANDDDLKRMAAHLSEALRAGAVGLSTSQSPHHETSDDRPVASRLADWRELRALAHVMSEHGVGIIEGAFEGVNAEDPDERLRAWRNVASLAADLRVPVTAGLVATSTGGRHMLDMLDWVAERGGRVIGQTHCRGISVLLGFRTRLPFDPLPEWRELRQLPLADQKQLLARPEVRSRLAEIAMRHDYSEWRNLGAMPRKPDFEGIRVYERGLPPNPTVGEVARQRGVSPAEAMIDLSVESDFEQLFIQPSLYPQDERVLLDAMRHPRTVMTFSDSGAHVGQIADASIHTYLLGHWVRDRQEFTLEEAVRMITLAPAMAWGFADRGMVREGMVADLNVFDPDTVGPAVPAVVGDLPAGGKRLEQRAVGFKATVVGGEVTIADGQSTGRHPGRLLRSALAHRAGTR